MSHSGRLGEKEEPWPPIIKNDNSFPFFILYFHSNIINILPLRALACEPLRNVNVHLY